jgi:hypothetical protein
MSNRLDEFALSLHPEKTRLIEFERFAAEPRKRRGLGTPETFNFLGFTFICGKSRSGKFQIQRKTRRDRILVKLRKIKETLRRCMHRPIPEQGKWLPGGALGDRGGSLPTKAFRLCAPAAASRRQTARS